MKFKPELVEEIVAGRKNSTWRLFDDKDLKAGDELELVNKETLEKFADAEIVNIREKKLGEIEQSDYEGHEQYLDKEKMVESFKKYYGDRVNLDTAVKIVEFKIINFI